MKRILSILLSAVILSSTACLTACGITLPSFKTTPDETGEQPTSYMQDEPTVPELPVISTEKETDEQPTPRPTPAPEKPNATTTPVENIDKGEVEKPSQQTNKTDNNIAPTAGGDDYYLQYLYFSPINDGTEYSVRLLNSSADVKEIVIPEYYDGKPVTEIRDRGFYKCETLETISMGGIIKIGEEAFYEL